MGITEIIAIVTVGIAVVGLVTKILHSSGYFGTQTLKGQLEAKDEVIQTNIQNISALTKRVEILENTGRVNNERIKELEKQLAVSEARYTELKQYAAPDLVERFEHELSAHRQGLMQLLDQQHTAIDRILSLLQQVENRRS